MLFLVSCPGVVLATCSIDPRVAEMCTPPPNVDAIASMAGHIGTPLGRPPGFVSPMLACKILFSLSNDVAGPAAVTEVEIFRHVWEVMCLGRKYDRRTQIPSTPQTAASAKGMTTSERLQCEHRKAVRQEAV